MQLGNACTCCYQLLFLLVLIIRDSSGQVCTRLSYHNIAIVYCNDLVLCDAVVLAVAVHEYCKTLPYIIFSGSDAGISSWVGIFPFAFAIKTTSCWDRSASASIINIPIPGPLRYASISLLCCFYRSLSGFICAHSASSPCSPSILFCVIAPSRPIFPDRHCSLLSLAHALLRSSSFCLCDHRASFPLLRTYSLIGPPPRSSYPSCLCWYAQCHNYRSEP
jgi:hypothetical protein